MIPAAALATGKARAVRWLIGALVALIAVLALLGTGYHYGWKHKANAVAKEQLAGERETTRKLNASIKRNGELVLELAAAKANQKVVYRTVKERVPYVVTQFIERPGASPEPVPACLVSRGYVRVWNDALRGVLSDAAAGAADAAAGADPAGPLAPSRITAGALLNNHVDNAEQCDATRRQLDALIKWHRDEARKSP